METLSATVRILDRPYKLKINPRDEEFLRKAAEMIDSQAREYAQRYAYTDRQDLLAMVALVPSVLTSILVVIVLLLKM